MHRPTGVIFDLGGTILHQEWLSFVAGGERLLEFAESAPDLTAEEIQFIANEINEEVQRFRDGSMVEFGIQSFHRLLYEHLDISFSISFPELEREFWNAAVVYSPTEGIFDVLDLLDKHQIKTGILSNSAFRGAVLEEELAKHDLAHRFPFLISSIDYGFRKPHRRLFQIAVRKINLEPHDIWFVGDKLEYDIRGAIDYGLYPVWYNPESKPGEIDGEYLEVKSWHEFREKVESLCDR